VKLSQREKVMLIGGGSIALVVALTAWLILPLHHRWTDLGRRLEPDLCALETMRERTDRLQHLLARRQRLIREMGRLVEPEPEPEQKEEAEQQPGPPAEGGKPPNTDDRSEAPEPADKPNGYELEAEVEKVFKECGAGLKLLSAKRLSRLGLRPEQYEMIGLQVETETKVESLIKLLHRIEKGQRFMRVDRLKLRHNPGKPLAVTATMELVAYERLDGK